MGSLPSGIWIAIQDPLQDRLMLRVDDRVAAFARVQPLQRTTDIPQQQIEQAAHHMDQRHVMRSIGDGEMKVGVHHRVVLGLANAALDLLQLGETTTQNFPVGIGGAQRGEISRHFFQGMAQLQHVEHGLGMLFQQLDQGVGEDGRNDIDHEIPPTPPALQETSGFQRRDRFPQ